MVRVFRDFKGFKALKKIHVKILAMKKFSYLLFIWFISLNNLLAQSVQDFTPSEWEFLKEKVEFVFVPGLFSKLTTTKQIPMSFIPQRYWLDSWGGHYTFVSNHTQRPSHENMSFILHTLEKLQSSNRYVLLIGHSKGGLEILETLLRHPEFHGNILGIITYQSPFKGSPLSDYFLKLKKFHKVLPLTDALFEANIKTIIDLSTDYRHEYLETNKNEIQELVEKIPFVSVGARIKGSPFFPRFFARKVFEDVTETDGIVPASSAHLEGTYYYCMENASHTDLVNFSYNGGKFAPKSELPDKINSFKMFIQKILSSSHLFEKKGQ
jgi:hypothetical protein